MKKFAQLILITTIFNFSSMARAAVEGQSEVYTFEWKFKGEPVVASITLFPESPLENPNLIEQIKKSPVDHVVFIDEGQDDYDRAPNQDSNSEFENLQAKVRTESGKPVESVKPKKGFFQAMGSAFKDVFAANQPKKSDTKYAWISVGGKGGSYMVMAILSKKVTVMSGLVLALVQGVITYYDNRWNFGIKAYLEANWHNPGKPANKWTFLARSLFYKYAVYQLYKLSENPALWTTSGVQMTLFATTLMAGVGEVKVGNAIYQAFKSNSDKVSKLNFYVSGIGAGLASIDLLAPKGMSIFEVGAYEFKYSGAALLAYYGWLYYRIVTNPEGLYRSIVKIEDAIAWLFAPVQRAGKAVAKPVVQFFKAFSVDCDTPLKGLLPDRKLLSPPQDKTSLFSKRIVHWA